MMLSFSHPLGVVNVRTVGVLFSNNRVLLHHAEYDSFWTLPGGRIEFGEDAAMALVREMKEELNAEVHVERLLWVVENFFMYNERAYHELAFYFLITLPEEHFVCQQDEFIGKEEEQSLVFRWLSVAELADMEVYPVFLKEGLQRLPDTITHVVQRETKEEHC